MKVDLEDDCLEFRLSHQHQQLGRHSLQAFEKLFPPEYLRCGGNAVTRAGGGATQPRTFTPLPGFGFHPALAARCPGRGPEAARWPGSAHFPSSRAPWVCRAGV